MRETPNSSMVATMRRLFKEQKNNMDNYIVRHISDVIRMMIVQCQCGRHVISRPRLSSNQAFPVQGNPTALGYVPSTFAQFNNVNNLGKVIPPPVRIL